MQEPLEDNLQTLPETLDIIYQEYSNTTDLLKDIAGLLVRRSNLSRAFGQCHAAGAEFLHF